MTRLSEVVGAGLITVGMGAALVTGAAAATADSDSGSSSGSSESSSSGSSGASGSSGTSGASSSGGASSGGASSGGASSGGATSGGSSSGTTSESSGPDASGSDAPDNDSAGGDASVGDSSGGDDSGSDAPGSDVSGPDAGEDIDPDGETDSGAESDPAIGAGAEGADPEVVEFEPVESAPAETELDTPAAVPTGPARASVVDTGSQHAATPEAADPVVHEQEPAALESPAAAPPVAEVVAVHLEEAVAEAPLTEFFSATAESEDTVNSSEFRVAEGAAISALATQPKPGLIGLVTSLIFGLLTAFERLFTGSPVVPAGSSVTVRNSSLQITDRMRVEANWYFPEGDTPPERIILLQHGFLAIGPMYSHTAARLAQDTNSIVVTPTLTSNVFATGGFWLGGDALHSAIADLFTGDRAALTASALAAGYAQRYGLDPQDAQLPRKFALAGHSLGGALALGAAGFLAETDAADDLVGVVTMEGVPMGDQAPNALARLADYQDRTGRHIPVREIGAPKNAWNSSGNLRASLQDARPDSFNGVTLRGGVHQDAMVGHNSFVQFLSYLFTTGFPKSQNSAAVRMLLADWIEDYYTGDDGDEDLLPGTVFTIDTPKGVATATVLGTAAKASLTA